MLKLNDIAASMRKGLLLQAHGYASYPLSGGLVLILVRNEPRWRLTLRRREIFPSDNEIKVCRRAFGVPEGTDEQRRVQSERINARQSVVWWCVDLAWREIETMQTSLFADSGGAATA